MTVAVTVSSGSQKSSVAVEFALTLAPSAARESIKKAATAAGLWNIMMSGCGSPGYAGKAGQVKGADFDECVLLCKELDKIFPIDGRAGQDYG
jgi:hypothetical protein